MDPTKKELYTAKRDSGVDMTTDGAILETFTEIKTDNDTNWMLVSLIGSSPKVQFNAKGSSVDGFISAISDDDAFYGVIRVQIAHHAVECTKFIQVFFMGDNVGGMKRGKHSMFKSGVFNVLDGCHGEIVLDGGAGSVSRESIVTAIAATNRINSADVSLV